jgi:choline dehydrogenase-like flavoprotein
MRAIVVGTGAGGATAARELASDGFEVVVLEAGKPFKPFSRKLSWAAPLRRAGVLGGEGTISRLFPAMEARRSSEDLVLVRGITAGGCTVLSCGNIVRAERGLREIGLDLTPEFEELEKLIGPRPMPRQRWRPLTGRMFDSAEKMGLGPRPTPKAVDVARCASCGLCELGCARGARWDSRRFLEEAVAGGAMLRTGTAVTRVLLDKGKAVGVTAGTKGERIKGDLVVLAAGAIGDAQILRASGLPAQDHLWADIVLTLGGVSKGANQLNEPPMVWFALEKDYIISPYIDVLSHWFHGPWRNVPIEDRVGVMVKLADEENGSVLADGTVKKSLTENDRARLDDAIGIVRGMMESSGVSGPFTEGMLNGGHFGGTIPLAKEDVTGMHPLSLPEGLWAADLSLAPRSQGLPTMLTASALALRVARRITEAMK